MTLQMCAGSTARFSSTFHQMCEHLQKNAYKFFCDNFYYFKSAEEKNKAGIAFSEMIYKSNDKKIALIFYKLFGYKDSNILS